MNDHALLANLAALKNKLRDLAEENARLRYERDCAQAQIQALLPLATPEQHAEYQRLKDIAIPGGLANFIAEYEAELNAKPN